MRPLLLTDETRAKVAEVVAFAEAHPFTMDDILDVQNKQMPVAGDMAGFSCEIPIGFRVVYSIELQPAGKIRHLSISIDAPDRMPNMIATQEIVKLFGFTGDLNNCKLGIEKLDDDHKAINIWELYNQS